MIYPAGTALECPTCERTLYRTTVDLEPWDVVKAEHLERVDGVHEPAFGVVVACPDHGPIQAVDLVRRRPE